MPNLEKKNGALRWRASVMVRGVQRRKWFPDDSRESKRQAIAWELEEKRRLTQQLTQQQSQTPSSCSIHKWATGYLEDVRVRYSRSTLVEKVGAFRLLMRFLQQRGLDPITSDVRTLTRELAATHLQHQMTNRSGYAANKDRKNLASGWSWGARFRDTFPQDVSNPFTAVPKFREERNPRYVPSVEDFWKVVDVAQGQDKAMLLSFLYLGARRKELFGLKWEDVDFAQERVRLWTNKREGGREFDWLPMATQLKQGLTTWRTETPYPNAAHVFVATWESSSPTHRAGEPFLYRQHLMSRLCRRARVPTFTFHAIRHLTAVQLRREGARLGVIQLVLRHRNARTTEIYLRSLGMDMAETRVALEGLGGHRDEGQGGEAGGISP